MKDKGRQPKPRDRGDGRVYPRGRRWWIEYWRRGKQYREASGKTEAEARRKLKARLKEIAGDRFVGPQEERLFVTDLLDALLVHLQTKGAPSARTFGCHTKPLRGCFAFTRALDLTAAQVERYARERLEQGRAPKTVCNEIATLRQAFNLARKQGRLSRVPYMPMLKADNARQGFFEREEFEAVVSQLPDPVNDIARFAYLTGWRKGEILPLRWDAVDRLAREVRLHTSKNGHGRVLPLDGVLWNLIERRWRARQVTSTDGTVHVSEYVFGHQGKYGGTPRAYVNIDKSWKDACRKAGLSHKLFHDFRRTAARDMVRAGVPQSVAMSITGHRTVSMFLRYNITSADDMREAIRRTQEHRASRPSARTVVPFPSTEPGE